jgi:hypothetical protein
VHENPIISVCWVDIDLSRSFGLRSLLGHPIDNCHHTTFFFRLT